VDLLLLPPPALSAVWQALCSDAAATAELREALLVREVTVPCRLLPKTA